MNDKIRIHLGDIEECLKGGWWLYHCQVEDEQGNLKEGTIQSDGHMHAMETLELNEE